MADYKIKVGDTSIEAVNPVNGVSPYNLTCNVVRVAYTNTALGCTEVPSNIVTSMSCSIEWKSSSEKDEHKKITHFDLQGSGWIEAGVNYVVISSYERKN